MNKHTPGPWVVSASGPTVYALHGAPARNRFSAYVQAGREDDASFDELRANATLMAAAPDLLEALRDLLHAFPGDYESPPAHIIKARAAIAKATQ